MSIEYRDWRLPSARHRLRDLQSVIWLVSSELRFNHPPFVSRSWELSAALN